MKIVIAGAGEVGFYLTKMLAQESHDITVIDNNSEVLGLVESYTDVITIHGSATSIKTLQEAGVAQADMLIAVTQLEEINLLAASIGKQLGARTTIARVDNQEFLEADCCINFRGIGIDSMIYPSELATTEIAWLIKRATARNAFEFENGKLTLLELTITEDAPVVNRTISEVAQMYAHLKFRIVAVVRNAKTIIPTGDNSLRRHDLVFIIADTVAIDEIFAFTGHQKIEISNIMILGGSKLGVKTAQRLGHDYKVKLIESNRDKCTELANQLNNTMVLYGDGRNLDLLVEEGIARMDAFIAVTGDTETNILSCLTAKKMGVKKTIALVENMGYLYLTQTLGIDTVINQKLIAASHIFSFIRKGEIVLLMNLSDADAEIVEYVVKPGTKITKGAIKELSDFPKGAIIGGVVRGNESFITVGDSVLKPNDRVVVFSKPEAIHAVEKFFH
ncbi:MAG TPA: Trk system potassium transporter TrkA [Anaerolineae bacterium]|nr:Trk system potassium transporter TrkA [Anaerolineae bacterium]HMR65277.1 Trk system potassium transporter TrkA [Anaerolineae bacterium]